MRDFHWLRSLHRKDRALLAIAATGTAALGVSAVAAGISYETYRNTAGVHRTFSTLGTIQPQRSSNAFFLPFRVNNTTNGKTCEHCHFASDGWGLLVDHVNDLFDATGGTHPLFTPDSADNPVTASNPANVDTEDKRRGVYSLMLNHGLALVRINFLPAARSAAEFALIGVKDNSIALPTTTLPDGNAAGDPAAYFAATNNQFWFHRRPLPTTNFRFLTDVSWEGRSTQQPNPSPANVQAGIDKVSHDTIVLREGGAGQPDSVLNPLAGQMDSFMNSTTTAQIIDYDALPGGAGSLMTDGALNGPTTLAATPFSPAVNDPFMPGFDRAIFKLYNQGWVDKGTTANLKTARAQVLRGQTVFNSKLFQITNVPGLNDKVGQASVAGSCGTCHNTPNVGNHSSKFPVAFGVAGAVFNSGTGVVTAPAGLNDAAVNDLPLFVLQNKTTGEILRVTDLGLGAITGQWKDIGKFKVALPRNLESRSPYFHNGTATSLEELVDFYNNRFTIGMTEQEKADLVAFLKAL